MKTYYIGIALNLLQAGFFNVRATKTETVFIISKYRYIERLKKPGKCFTGISKTDQTNCFSGQFSSPVFIPYPLPLSNFIHAGTKLVQQRKQHAKCMFSHCIAVTFRTA